MTLEEFLESERHKLTGTLTPVTPESFAKWKSERMSKKAAEEQAKLAKEATGRALFESGNWRFNQDNESEDDDSDDDEGFSLAKMRKETEALRQKKEDARLAAANAQSGEETVAEPPDSGDGEVEVEAEASGS